MAYFPAAFQVLFLALAATFGWGANLWLLSRAGVEVRSILQLSSLPGGGSSAQQAHGMHQNIFRLGRILASVVITGWLLCTLVFADAPAAQTRITLLTYIAIAAILVLPQRILCHTVRMQFLQSMVRIAKPSLAGPVFLCDVIMADILTSYARPLGDMALVSCQLVHAIWPAATHYQNSKSGIHAFSRRDGTISSTAAMANPGASTICASGTGGVIGLLLVASPYAIRLRQCVNEYLRSSPGCSDARRHFANAIKYASSFPVLLLSPVAQRHLAPTNRDGFDTKHHQGWSAHALFWLWILAISFNSLYSFYWDIAFDWDLGYTADGTWSIADLIMPSNSNVRSGDNIDDESKQPAMSDDPLVVVPSALSINKSSLFLWLLRPRLHFRRSWLYHVAMAVDFLLRIIWILKLSSYARIDQMAYGAFWLNALELFRRWQWTFLRIEKEAAGTALY